MSKNSKKVIVVYRSAKTGEFVKERFAKDHPSTTIKQHIKVIKKK